MKSLLSFIILIALLIQIPGKGIAAPKDSLYLKYMELIIGSNYPDSIKLNKLSEIPPFLKENKKESVIGKKETECFVCNNKSMTTYQNVLVILPVVLGILFIIILIFWIRVSNYSLKDALSSRQIKLKKDDDTINVSAPLPSTSRLMAFITGICAIIIALCLTTYYGYYEIAECNGKMEFDGLWKILVGLGIGVLPYGINVWNGNAKEVRADS